MRNYSINGEFIVGISAYIRRHGPNKSYSHIHILPAGTLSLTHGGDSQGSMDNLYSRFKYDSLYYHLRRKKQCSIPVNDPLSCSLSFGGEAIVLKINKSATYKSRLNRHDIASKNPDMINLFNGNRSIQHFCNLETTKPNKNYE